jgi:Ca2+-binding RTX toxin-like protein
MATIVGKATDDKIDGTRLDDNLSGQGGNDTIIGGLSDDQIDGGEGNDRLEGGADDDIIFGGTGNDELFDGTHDDTLYGGIGDDKLHATYGSDYGGDTLDGGAGNDLMDAVADHVTMTGGDGNDTMVAGKGGSSMNGGPGDDTMTANIGSDTFISEKDDADTFLIDASAGGFGFDRIDGFNGEGKAGGDVLRLAGFEEGEVIITEQYSFGGSITYGGQVVADKNAAAAEDQSNVATVEQVNKYSGLYGPPSESSTTFSSDFGDITVDAVGLKVGQDYFWDFG